MKTNCARVVSVLESPFTLECVVDQYRVTDRGIEVDIMMMAIDTSQVMILIMF